MDRVIAYDGALPQTTDLLYTNKFALLNAAYQNRAMLGTTTVVAGLAITPTSPVADLHVTIGVGSIFQMDPTDASAYGDLGVDNNSIMKQGLLQSPVVLSITPPGTAGQSQVYLVQAILNDVDAGQTVLSYYNSADEAHPFAGPAGSGISQFTTRTCPCVVALKAGVPATTGTQTTPSPNAGYIGLYAVTVANGATQVTSGNIAQLATAPFFPTLPQVPVQVQQGTYVYAGQDTGTANNYVVTFAAGQPVPTAYVAGMGIKFKALNACSGASVVNVNGLGNVNIRRASGAAVTTADIVSGQMVELTYDGTNFQMQNYMGAGAGTNTTTAVSIPYIADSGAQNALVGTYSPAITSGQQVAGLALEIKLTNNITGGCTINVNGLGVKAVKTGDLQNPPANVYVAGEVLLLIYDGTQYQIANSTSLIYRKPSANITIFVNASTGSDTLYDGTSASVVGGSSTAGPFATQGRAVLAAWGYAPSQFNITISVAAGTYNEIVSTPSYAGPNVTIDGGSLSTTTTSSGSGTCYTVTGPNTLKVQNITVQNSAPGFGGFSALSGATITTNNTASNAIGGPVFGASQGATCNAGNHTYNGSCQVLWEGALGGTVNIVNSSAHVFSGSISVSTASAFASVGGYVIVDASNPPIFTNPSFVNGLKFNATYNGIVNNDGHGLSFFPGNAAGVSSNGGIAIP